MGSFTLSFLRLLGVAPRSRPPDARPPDEEHATGTVADDSALGASMLQPSHHHAPFQRIPADNTLMLFRLTLGITAAPHLGFSQSTQRPADNLGLYARVVHAEQTAKDQYKVFSVVINACYFLQIIVAASVTAMGAANANNKAVTAFGAINTIIAGFLTYLKGSGYPARFKYCADEWKKVREYIEHRERDFSLEGCTLDVYEEIDNIREMYELTKRDIEVNQPEAYNAKSASGGGGGGGGVARFDRGSKLRSFDETVRKLKGRAGLAADALESRSSTMAAKVRSLEDSPDKMTKHIEKTAEDGGEDAAYKAVRHVIEDAEKRVIAEARNLEKAVVRGAEEHKPRPPREVSVMLSHRDGDDDAADQIEVAPKK
ncbi:hypothetical protein MYCTH_2299111 [Thermothelomyces thermophilus ATCC 42464]|uniref:SMODS and SLOG-associating 2TM effector domain-containing protein n=1 Tax=Thermothelomyces thermophilus (strain ATCC 42464 / BCRC 31852 / DSM 1799) TaxID=573729 RepID=G2Q4S5_THET4|nr:uncharacterized protein MYCTH_2299111 [Thermothelomyces thermophilus ATCC 42464]AEO55364.1 hypothetical protein MYCTH_2299111 [Thermothelomyces thermophilus ATCC 42464]